MFFDFLFPANRGKQQPVDALSAIQAGMVSYADGVNWNPIGDGVAGYVRWTGTAWARLSEITDTGWVDYSTTSTITGWSSFTTKVIRYRKIGHTVFVEYSLAGTSNNTTTNFTLPYAKVNTVATDVAVRIEDNGVFPSTPGLMELLANTSQANLYKDFGGTAFTNSGTKFSGGQFWYETSS